jgi:type IV pilus assembly protein PilQ
VRVAPAIELEKERKDALEAQKARALLEPLRVRLIPVNYALAGDVSDKIKDVLSDRGAVTVDTRTNVLIVKDIAENLAKAEGMVRNLDTQTPQVLIESRIVEAATQFTREIGIQWGGNAGFAPNTNNATGLTFPSTATVSGAAGGTPNAGTAANPNFAVNLPAAIGPGSGAGLGFIFGSAGGAFNLNLRLSALENNGVVKTVSAPKIATLDNQESSISQGVSIPFAQVSAAGVQTAFIEARLELKVTPHVTSDGSILMKISATNNQPNAGITGANGQPSISRKEAKTQMLIRDGDTSVIGGIYTRATGVQVNTVPLFGNIPVLGWLFKHQADTDARTELLIFITPRILNRQQVLATGT